MKLNDVQKHFIEKYKDYFNNTGGYNIIELLEGETTSYNIIYRSACWSQLTLIETLNNKNLINFV